VSMKYYLAKTDPKTYSIEDFEKDKVTEWDGVRSPQAVIFLKQMQGGDRVLIYHSQGEATIVGLAEVVPNSSRPAPGDSRSWWVDMKLIKKFDPPFVTLQELKATGKFLDFRLIRQSRLSVMPVPDNVIEYLKDRGLPL
jgi:predicted RNA-binding protein with PUA-like domain